MNTFDLTLDLSKRGLIQTVQIRQGDTNGTTIVATITDHGVAASTSGMTARFSMRLPNGTEYYRKAASLSGNTATVTIDEAQAASVAGRTDVAYFQLIQGSTVVASTESFTVVVLPDALADATVPESYDSAIQDAIDALDDAVEQLPATVEDVLADHPEWTTTVQDGSITKAKLATDLARDRERLMYRLDNLLTATLPEGETATATDAAKTPMAALALYGRSTQNGTPTPSSPVPIVSVGSANLLPSDATSTTISGITFDVNGDGSVHVSGTATATAAYDFLSIGAHDVTLPTGTYMLSGCPAGGSGSTWKLDINDTNNTYTNDYGSGVAFTVASTRTIRRCRIVVYSGQTVDFTYKPMLNAGTIAYPYVPYDHAGLWARGKNLWSLGQEYSRTSAGDLFARSAMHVPAGQYTLSFDVVSFTSGSNNNVQLLMYDQSVTVVTQPSVALRTGRVSLAVNPSRDVESLKLFVGTACTLANFQLEHGTTATAYQPYEQTVTPVPLDGHELRSLPDGTRDEVTVDARGHAVLVQRVGSVTLDGSETWAATTTSTTNAPHYRVTLAGLVGGASITVDTVVQCLQCDHFPVVCDSYGRKGTYNGETGVSQRRTDDHEVWFFHEGETLANWKTWLAANPTTIDYALATPVTHDLGTIDPVPLCGPDLTAQAVPSAPFALRYERDLNVTLARLESAIATLA